MTLNGQVSIKIDLAGAAERLAKGVGYQTISNQDQKDFDTEACLGYHNF